MSSQLEQEIKYWMAGPDEFATVLNFLGPAQGVLLQRNHYFSDRQGQPSPDWVLRLRDQDGQHELTLKLGRSQRAGYFESLEVSCEVEPELAGLILQGEWPESLRNSAPMQRLRQEFGLDRPTLLGSLVNRRHPCPQSAGWVAELDITQFPNGQVDYELEIETDQLELVQAQLQPLAGLLNPQTKTKYRRFLERINP